MLYSIAGVAFFLAAFAYLMVLDVRRIRL